MKNPFSSLVSLAVLLVIIFACVFSAYYSYTHPGFFSGLVLNVIQQTKSDLADQQPTVFDGELVDENSSIPIATGHSEHNLEFYKRGMLVDFFKPRSRVKNIVIMVLRPSTFEDVERFESYKELARSAQKSGSLVIVPHYVYAGPLLYAESIRRMVQVSRRIEGLENKAISLAGFFEGGKVASYVASQEKESIDSVMLHESFLDDTAESLDFQNYPPVRISVSDDESRDADLNLMTSWLDEHEVIYEVDRYRVDGNLYDTKLFSEQWFEGIRFFLKKKSFVKGSSRKTVTAKKSLKRNPSKQVSVKLNPEKLTAFTLADGETVVGEIQKDTGDSYLVLTRDHIFKVVSKRKVVSAKRVSV